AVADQMLDAVLGPFDRAAAELFRQERDQHHIAGECLDAEAAAQRRLDDAHLLRGDPQGAYQRRQDKVRRAVPAAQGEHAVERIPFGDADASFYGIAAAAVPAELLARDQVRAGKGAGDVAEDEAPIVGDVAFFAFKDPRRRRRSGLERVDYRL